MPERCPLWLERRGLSAKSLLRPERRGLSAKSARCLSARAPRRPPVEALLRAPSSAVRVPPVGEACGSMWAESLRLPAYRTWRHSSPNLPGGSVRVQK